MNFKLKIKKTWDFIWKDDSFLSLLINIIVAFVLIKWIVYPVLGAVLSTSYPIVAVVSGSMEHNGLSFQDWWNNENSCCIRNVCNSEEKMYQKYNITREKFKNSKFKNGFNKGDIMILYGSKKYYVGDVLVFKTNVLPEPIIHRVVISENFNDKQLLTTKGDNNCGSSPFEKRISQDRFVGKAILRIPLLGWIKIGFVEAINFIVGVFK